MAPKKTVGILGGGQLGRMLAHPASLLSIPLLILDSGVSTPAKQVIAAPPRHSHIDGPFTSAPHIRQLAEKCDVLTVEIEHVDAGVLEEIEKEGIADVQPSPRTIRLIQDKYLQKVHLQEKGIPVAPFAPIPSNPTASDWSSIGSTLGTPLMIKSRTMAYDGKGNSPLPSLSESDISASLSHLGSSKLSLYAEAWQPFLKEVAVMVVRNKEGQVKSYDAVETVHKDSILRLCLAPLRVSGKGMEDLNHRAKELAEKAVSTLEGAGIFGVEMFLLEGGELLINEIAPRPHNSGHHTIEACSTSQFENHLRAVVGLPLGGTALRVPVAGMINLIGTSSSWDPIDKIVEVAHGVEGATTHLYGKAECRKGRKVGHITVTANSEAELHERLLPILSATEDLAPEWISSHSLPPPKPSHSHPYPLVGIIMGSDSDLPTMLPGARILDAFGIPYELTIVSAHRTPARMVEYAHAAQGRGLRAIIAGAGGAAHLPGMVASETVLPVIGVPVKASVLDGVDSLYSILQMPVSLGPGRMMLTFYAMQAELTANATPKQRGIPVATVGIANSTNAALLAIRILATSLPHLVTELDTYIKGLETEVLVKVNTLEGKGWEEYAKGLAKK